MISFAPLLFIGVLGMSLGSFATATAQRLEQGVSLRGRSRCDHCQAPVGLVGLIPLVGFFLVCRRCSVCHQPLSWVYPLSELAAGALAFWLSVRFGPNLEAVYWLALALGLSVISWLDIRTGHIYTGPVLGLVGVQTGWLFGFAPERALESLIGLLAGAGLFHWVSTFFLSFRGKEGLGQGDATLLGLLGFIFGWQALLPLVFLSAASGLVISLLLWAFKQKSLSSPIPFGPYLALAALCYQGAPIFWKTLFHLY